MCGRKTLTKDMKSIIEELAVDEWENPEDFHPSYNITPTQTSPILIYDNGSKVKMMKWGLIPHWAKDESIGAKLINARSETLTEKPSFQNLVSKNRCIVISDGYYEWKRIGKQKQPYYIHHPENKLLLMAGLWSQWKSKDKTIVFSYTVITTTPTPDIAFIHSRMPVILSEKNLPIWLNGNQYSSNDALKYLIPFETSLTFSPVSPFVNSPKNNSMECIKPLDNLPTMTLF